MALAQTVNEMRNLLNSIQSDLEKAVGGNKAASQRVRTGTVSLEKIAKKYRKESIVTEKGKTKGPRKAAAPKKKATASKGPVKAQPKAKSAPAAKAKPKAKAKTAARPRALAVKRPTAKLPVKRRAHF